MPHAIQNVCRGVSGVMRDCEYIAFFISNRNNTHLVTNYSGCFASQSICSVISRHSGMPMALHPLELPKVDVDHLHMPVWASHFIILFFLSLFSLCVPFVLRTCVNRT